jgi:hypothetical protein
MIRRIDCIHPAAELRAITANSRPFGFQLLLQPATEAAIVVMPFRIGCFEIMWYVSGCIDTGDGVMKALVVAAALLALIVMPAHAQMGGRRHQGEDKKSEQPAKKIDEKAYKAALERIPEPKEKYDPWGVARPAEPAKKPK